MKPVPDTDGIQRDKATILAIIKYLMIAGITVAVLYAGLWLFGILLPFVFGFVLAQVANGLAAFILDVPYAIRQRRHTGRKASAAALPNETAKIPADTAGSGTVAAGRRKRGHYPRGLIRPRLETRLAIAIYFVEVIGLIGLVFVIVSGSISQLRSLASYLPDFFKNTDIPGMVVNYLQNLSNSLGGLLPADFMQTLASELADLQSRLIQAVPDIAANILTYLAAWVGFLPILLFIIIVVIMSGYYFTAQSRFLYMFMRRNITSKTFREKSVRLVTTLSTTLFRVFGGYLFLLLVTFSMAMIGLIIIKMPYPVIFAVILALVDLLPVLGIGTTMIPISIYMFISGNVFGGIGSLVLLAAMIFVRRVIEPTVMGNALKLHPMATLVAMIVGYGVYGLGGIILAPVIFVIGREIMVRFGFDRKLRDIFRRVLDRISV